MPDWLQQMRPLGAIAGPAGMVGGAAALAAGLRAPRAVRPVVPGTIDLYNRPEVPNQGGLSTVYSASFNIDGKEVLLPLADDGRILTDEEAVQKYLRTGQHLGIFDTPDAASAYAAQLHTDYEAGKYRARRK